MVNFQDLRKLGIRQVKHIVNGYSGNFYRLNEIIEQYGDNFNFMHYNMLADAIPNVWVRKLKSNTTVSLCDTIQERCFSMKHFTKFWYDIFVNQHASKHKDKACKKMECRVKM